MRVLVDTNIIIDVLQNREPWCNAGKQLFLAIANKQIIGCVTAKEIADIHYISRKQFKGHENIDGKCRDIIAKILTLFELLDTMAADCQNAFAIQNNDYEDAIMLSTAIRCRVDCIITRDKEHYIVEDFPIYTPDIFIEKMNDGF
ncbi:MAG: PIN domain-containing protein [Lachnospiraceae bacterium]|nr:PIN domain-containing protein [Lachnospiraceae bacterium]